MSVPMQPAYRIHRLSNTTAGLEEVLLAYARAAIIEARQMLVDNPCPDTFVGRKTQQPFPWEEVL